MRLCIILVLILSLMAAPLSSYAHSGGTDANGCHGGSEPYHCHGTEGGSSGGGSLGGGDEFVIVLGVVVGVTLLGLMVWGIVAASRGGKWVDDQPEELDDSQWAGVPRLDLAAGENSGGLSLSWWW